ncbi:MAG: helix-turn-helix domain-containing protein [Candidatus Eisenbacteria bacterium]|uniref:Helix-turn-helix domain-containing protein n=1 Tax=Eiseniibacteriota bacterium TaxID=2212470 RepID=A0A948W5H3_UNCEI|nr:helix-turn-helix domain-containing protein [Candidatus Eisenbacteria bacterium]MBU1947133.1 helix-turn-helix domain-containing protein [Candidatus Eisenbacteria bacterium]MBU2689995.1 helix-turn-helix domain-containing protein [Candidatus Eisenbacteria bacterium]
MASRSIYSLKEIAQNLGVHPATIVRWIETGKVAVKKKKDSSGHYVFTGADIKKFKAHKNAIHPVA